MVLLAKLMAFCASAADAVSEIARAAPAAMLPLLVWNMIVLLLAAALARPVVVQAPPGPHRAFRKRSVGGAANPHISDLIGRVVHLFHLRCVFDDETIRIDEIGEHIVARAVAADAPFYRQAFALEAAAAAHHSVEVRQVERDVADERVLAIRQRQRMMVCIATHEACLAGAVAQPEAKRVAHEVGGAIEIDRIQHDVAEPIGPIVWQRRRVMQRLVAEDDELAVGRIVERETVSAARIAQ